jgi:hypothetical protein
MMPMTTQPSTMYMRIIPDQHRITFLGTESDVLGFSRTTDCYPDENGMFRRERKDFTRDDIPLLGSVFVAELDVDGDRTGRFEVLTRREFREQFMEHEVPYFEFGIQCVSRPRDVVCHGTKQRCEDVLDDMPVLRDSGDYRIVRRRVTEPGDWEPLE